MPTSSGGFGEEEFCQRLEAEFCQRFKVICQQDRCGRPSVRQYDDCYVEGIEEAAAKGSALLRPQRRGLKLDEGGRQLASERIHRQQRRNRSFQTRTYPASSEAAHRAEEEKGLARADGSAHCRAVDPSRRTPAPSIDTSRGKRFFAGAVDNGPDLDRLSKSNREFYLKYGILKYNVRRRVLPRRPPGLSMPIRELPFEQWRKRPKGCSASRTWQENRRSNA